MFEVRKLINNTLVSVFSARLSSHYQCGRGGAYVHHNQFPWKRAASRQGQELLCSAHGWQNHRYGRTQCRHTRLPSDKHVAWQQHVAPPGGVLGEKRAAALAVGVNID